MINSSKWICGCQFQYFVEKEKFTVLVVATPKLDAETGLDLFTESYRNHKVDFAITSDASRMCDLFYSYSQNN